MELELTRPELRSGQKPDQLNLGLSFRDWPTNGMIQNGNFSDRLLSLGNNASAIYPSYRKE